MDEVSETLARILDRTGDCRIQRSVPSTITDPDRTAAGLAMGTVLDTETGVGSEDEVIDLGMLRFAYDLAGSSTILRTGTSAPP